LKSNHRVYSRFREFSKPAMPDSQPNYVVITVGTTGDMYPFISIAKALHALGRKVTLMGPEFHRDLLRQTGLPFIGIGTDADYQRAIDNRNLWHFRKGFAVLFHDCRAHLRQVAEALGTLPINEPHVVIAHPLTLAAASIARERGANIKIAGVYLAPSNLRTCHDPVDIGPLKIPRALPVSWRKVLWRAIDATVIDPAAVPEVNATRDAFGLPPIKHFVAHMESVADLTVTLFPAWFASAYPDWPKPVLMGDFQLFDATANETLTADVTRFLAAQDAPIVFTPGSGNHHASAYFAHALHAIARLGRRAIFLTRHRAQVPDVLPDSILWQPYVPLSKLLPHVAAIVHHGGIGTTAEALRAGVPQLVVPFAWDQFNNGARVVALGVGKVLYASRMHAQNLEQTLEALCASEATRAQCKTVEARFKTRITPEALCRAMEGLLDV
jgi:rhamnosyltransferase subunit B